MKQLIKKVLNKIYSLLTRQRVVVYSRALLFAIIIFFSLGILSGHIDTEEFKKGDFRAFYTAGIIVNETNNLNSMELYNLERQTSVQREYKMIEAGAIPTIYLNPPLYAWLMVPFTAMPYPSALAVWRLINVMVALLAVVILTTQLKLDLKWWDAFVIFIASYSAVSVIFLGQNTFLFLGLYAFALLLLNKGRDFAAGFILGLGALKPQLFIFLPVVLLFQKKVSLLLGFVSGVLVIISASFYLVGLEGIAAYGELITDRFYLQVIHAQVQKMHSFPAFIRLMMGTEINATYLALTAFLVLSLVLGYYSFKKSLRLQKQGLLALSILGSLIIAPHLFHYDLVLLLLPFLAIYAWTGDNYPGYRQARNYRLLLLALYLYLWASHFTVALAPVQFSLLMMVCLFLVTLKQGINDNPAGFVYQQK